MPPDIIGKLGCGLFSFKKTFDLKFKLVSLGVRSIARASKQLMYTILAALKIKAARIQIKL